MNGNIIMEYLFAFSKLSIIFIIGIAFHIFLNQAHIRMSIVSKYGTPDMQENVYLEVLEEGRNDFQNKMRKNGINP